MGGRIVKKKRYSFIIKSFIFLFIFYANRDKIDFASLLLTVYKSSLTIWIKYEGEIVFWLMTLPGLHAIGVSFSSIQI